MTGKTGPASTWHHTDVILRSDIFHMAQEQGIDIGDVCNRALADRIGIDYRQKHSGGADIAKPVIIVRNDRSALPIVCAPLVPQPAVHAVINADDPSAVTKVKQAKRLPVKKPVIEISVPAPPDENVAPESITTPLARERKSTGKKKTQQGAVKQFLSAKISREDAENLKVSKDDLYGIFNRWCHDHRISPVPDQRSLTKALKNQFAIPDKMVDGVSSWIGIRLK